MAVSIFKLFKIGIGPSSSHTVGPMFACRRFLDLLHEKKLFETTEKVVVELYGSLALTGIGHGTDKAVLLGLEGEVPNLINPDIIEKRIATIHEKMELHLDKQFFIKFDPQVNLVFLRRKSLPAHPNGMQMFAYDHNDKLLISKIYYSVGGGFVMSDDEVEAGDRGKSEASVKYPFTSAKDLLELSEKEQKTIAEIMFENEVSFTPRKEIASKLNTIWETMSGCIERGFTKSGILPGKLKVKRRAPELYMQLTHRPEQALQDPLSILDWVNLYAISVNEENASGSRVVTAPTNGAAGIIPAVLRYYERFCANSTQQGILDFLMTAGAIAILYTKNASISGAEVGCQGEVGVACSMAAGGLVAALKGTAKQIEQAAEIAMEHNLGLTCDPIGGLVQIPCIERNAMGAIKAINAARIALRGDGSHFVSLDNVIRTMKQTGADMKDKYKETSRGGLAVNVIEC